MATQTMAKDDQDFSFPTTLETPPLPRFLELPPVWWRTSAASHRENPREEGERKGGDDDDGEKLCYFSSFSSKEANHTQRRSFSCIEGRPKRVEDDHGDYGDEEEEEEDKMDMLWEDFNEEYKRSRELSPPARGNKKLEFKNVQSLKLSKASKRRPSMVDVMKVLKKVFLLHNPHNSTFKKHP